MEEFSAGDAQTIHLPDAEERAQLDDPLARLEHDERAKAIAREDAIRVSGLRADSDARWKDDYAGNKALRRRLRQELSFFFSFFFFLSLIPAASCMAGSPSWSWRQGAISRIALPMN